MQMGLFRKNERFFSTLQTSTKDDGYSCWGGSHSIDDMSNAMYNWHRALCAQKGGTYLFYLA